MNPRGLTRTPDKLEGDTRHLDTTQIAEIQNHLQPEQHSNIIEVTLCITF